LTVSSRLEPRFCGAFDLNANRAGCRREPPPPTFPLFSPRTPRARLPRWWSRS